MELSILREFTVLAQTCNFQETADHFSMTQSTLSKHIKKLEEELGLELFDRSTRSVKLNAYGIRYLTYAEQICQISDEASADLDAIRQGINSKLRVGMMSLHGIYGPVDTLAEFSRLHPNIKVELVEKDGDALREAVSNGSVDVIFCGEKVSAQDFRITNYTSDRLTAVLPFNHPLAFYEELTLNQLANEKFIEHKTNLEIRLFNEACEEAGIEPQIITSVYHTSTIMKLIKNGSGICVMSEVCAEAYYNKDIVLIPIVPERSFDINVVTSRKRPASPSTEAFVKYIRTLKSAEK